MDCLDPTEPTSPLEYMSLALLLAEKSPPKSTNFRVGAVLLNEQDNEILSTGYTLELPGNTHAEQCCLIKYAESHGKTEDEVADLLPLTSVLYTTMEPCGMRLSGNLPCVDRILKTRSGAHGGIKKVYVGVQEPEKFVGQNAGKAKLEAAGVHYIHVAGLEDDILSVATAGHEAETLQ